MADSTTRHGPLARLRDRLIVSASARHLAIDLVDRHGPAAAAALRAIAAQGGVSPRQRLVLARAEPIVADLIASGTRTPARPRTAPFEMAAALD